MWGSVRTVPSRPPLGSEWTAKCLAVAGDALSLQPFDLLDRQFSSEEGILRCSTRKRPTPARIAREIHGGRVNVGEPFGAGFLAGDRANLMDKFFVPGCPESDADREVGGFDGVEAADAFIGEVDGNAETVSFDEPALEVIDDAGVKRRWPGEFILCLCYRRRCVCSVDIGDAVFPDFVFSSWRSGRRL